ncbi:MAG: GntR family transcriptional regulator [Cytophagales bacterium]|nr:GntR family transcriptional regulator [Cytophagales bacterium]
MEKESTTDISSRLGLDPVMPLSMAETVEIKLQEYFKNQDFKIGDALPKEMELAEALGVSRNVIREALSRFRMLGLIESRKKRGMILTSPNILGGMERVLHPKFMDKKSLMDIFKLRLVLEMGMSDLLFIYKTDQDIKDLERIIAKKKKKDKTLFKLEFEIEFHGKLYEISRNETMKKFQYLLLPVFEHVIEYESELKAPRTGTATHEDIVRELKTGTPESFRTAMKKHLEPHFEMLKQWKNGNL